MKSLEPLGPGILPSLYSSLKELRTNSEDLLHLLSPISLLIYVPPTSFPSRVRSILFSAEMVMDGPCMFNRPGDH